MKKTIQYIAAATAAVGFLYLLAEATFLLASFIIGVGYLPGSTANLAGWYILSAVIFAAMFGPPIFFLITRNTIQPRKRKTAYVLLIAETLLLMYAWTIPNRNRKFCVPCDFVVCGIDFSKAKLTDADMTKRFGQGCRQTSNGWPDARLYHFSKAGVSMLLGRALLGKGEFYNHVKISRSSTPPEGCNSSRELSVYGTSKGVTLGESEKRIFEVYGPPREKNNIPSGVELMYTMPGKTMYFGVIDHKVDYIEVAVSD